MAIIVRDHVSQEAGHLAGVARILAGAGLVLVGLGVVVFFAAVLIGLVDARDGSVSASSSVGLLPVGGLAVVLGSMVAALGMLLGRRQAGE